MAAERRRVGNGLGEVAGIALVGNDGPVGDDAVSVQARPFHIHHGNPAKGTGTDGPQDMRVGDGRDKAFALQARFVLVDAAGNVHGQHQFQVDVLGLLGLGRRRHRQHCRHARRPSTCAHGDMKHRRRNGVKRFPQGTARTSA